MTTSSHPVTSSPTVLPIELAAAAWFALQAVLGVVLWVGAGASDVVRSWLELVADHPEVTDAFLPADVMVIVASATAAWALGRGRPWAVVPVMVTVGGVLYPTAYLIGWVVSTDGTGEVALGIMVATSAVTCGMATLLWRGRRRGNASQR